MDNWELAWWTVKGDGQSASVSRPRHHRPLGLPSYHHQLATYGPRHLCCNVM